MRLRRPLPSAAGALLACSLQVAHAADDLPPPPPPPGAPAGPGPPPPEPGPPPPRSDLPAPAAPPAGASPASGGHASQRERPRGELWLGLGLGSAVCDDEKPDSDCPVDGGGAFTLGGGWRFARPWLFGAELSAWSYRVNDAWRGGLEDPATDVAFGSSYLALLLRWYFVARGSLDAYLQLGVGVGTIRGEAENAGGTYRIRVTGGVVPLGVGLDGYLSRRWRLGGQLLGYVQLSGEACEEANGAETCQDATDEQNLAAWRALFTVTFGW